MTQPTVEVTVRFQLQHENGADPVEVVKAFVANLTEATSRVDYDFDEAIGWVRATVVDAT